MSTPQISWDEPQIQWDDEPKARPDFSLNPPSGVTGPAAWRNKTDTASRMKDNYLLPGPAGVDKQSPFYSNADLEHRQAQHEAWKDLPEGGVSEGRGLREGLAEYDKASFGQAGSGAADIARGQIARGTHKVISGAGNAISPALALAAPAMVAAPVATGLALGGGYLGSRVGRGAAEYLGATPDQADVAGDLGGLAGGYTGAKLPSAVAEVAPRVGPVGKVLARDVTSHIPAVGRLVRRPSVGDYLEALKRPQGEILPPSTDQIPGRPYAPRPRAVSAVAPIPQREGLTLPPAPAPRPGPAWRAADPAPQAPPVEVAPPVNPEQARADFRLRRTFENATPPSDPETAAKADFERHGRLARREFIQNNTITPPSKAEVFERFRAAHPPTGYSPAVPQAEDVIEAARRGAPPDIAAEVRQVRQADIDRRIKFGSPDDRLRAVQENADLASPEVQDKGWQRSNDLQKRKMSQPRNEVAAPTESRKTSRTIEEFKAARAALRTKSGAPPAEVTPRSEPLRGEANAEEKMRIAREMREGKHKWNRR